jgi:transcriptional regulator
MYLPTYTRETRPERLRALIEANPLATLISVHEGVPFVSHLPLLLEGDGETSDLIGHLAVANPHLRILRETPQVLCVFQGPQGYVSPRWYASPRDVPTWNYATAHATGHTEILESTTDKDRVLARLIAAQEPRLGGPAWKYEPDPAEHAELLCGIAAFRIRVTSLVGKFKLGQNRDETDRDGAIQGLESDANQANRELGAAMRAASPKDPSAR